MKNDQLSLFEHKLMEEVPKELPNLKNIIKIIPMLPAEYADEYQSLTIQYSFGESSFGKVIIGSTHKGVCYLAFEENKETALSELKKRYPKAHFINQANELQDKALAVFKNDGSELKKVTLHIKGTGFQLAVWNNLLNIPFGALTNYKHIAQKMGDNKLARPVGTSVGKNPVAYLIPCHRVVPLSGKVGGYRWGTERKKHIIQWERDQLDKYN